MKKYIMMIGLMSLIGVNYGEASDATTTSSSNSLRTKDSGKNSQKNEEIITAESSSNSLTTTRSSSDDSIEVDEKENTAIVLLPDSFAESLSDSWENFQKFNRDEERIENFVVNTAIRYFRDEKLDKLQNNEDFQLLMGTNGITEENKSQVLEDDNKIRLVRLYIYKCISSPYSLMKKITNHSEEEIKSYLNELKQAVLAMEQKKI